MQCIYTSVFVLFCFGFEVRFDCPVGTMTLGRLSFKDVVQGQIVAD